MLRTARSVFVLGFLFISSLSYAQNADINLLKNINAHETDFKNGYLKFCSASASPVSVAVPVSLITAGLISHDHQMQQNGLYMAGSFVATAILTQGLKHAVNRTRPRVTYPFIIVRDKENPGSYSMPSGHTSTAANTAAYLCFTYPKWYVIVPSCIWAASVGWSRMYLGVHYPSDVLVGAILGTGTAWLTHHFQKKWQAKPVVKKPKGL